MSTLNITNVCCYRGPYLTLYFAVPQRQGLDTQVIPKVKPIEKPTKKPAPNVIQFQFVMPVIIKDFFMFMASN